VSGIYVPDPEGHIRFGGDCTCGVVYCFGGVPEPGQFDPFCPDHGDPTLRRLTSMSYQGTRWLRKQDSAVIRIEGDADAGGGYSNRSLRAVNESTGRAFWVTPEGLRRKYERI